MDTLTTAERSERMSRVRSKDTKPEMTVRSLVHRMGYRYRLHDRSLPGTPDLNCEYPRWPESKLHFWRARAEKSGPRHSAIHDAQVPTRGGPR